MRAVFSTSDKTVFMSITSAAAMAFLAIVVGYRGNQILKAHMQLGGCKESKSQRGRPLCPFPLSPVKLPLLFHCPLGTF